MSKMHDIDPCDWDDINISSDNDKKGYNIKVGPNIY